MKKIIAMILGLALLLTAACAETSSDTSIFKTIAGMEWTFCSGVGAWSTDMWIQEDGTFRGEFHDSDMGDCTDEYPDGTVYFCSFSGRMSFTGTADGNAWKIHVDQLTVEPAEETIAEGIHYIPSDSYGISEGDDLTLYAPGTPVGIFSEELQFWAHILDYETPPLELEDWFLCNEKNETGFVGCLPVSMANPWEEMTAEQLADAAGLLFGVPEGAENVIYRYLRSAGLAEMQFTWANGEYCARIQSAILPEGELSDISGMYYDWEFVEPITVQRCSGTIAQAKNGDNGWVELCLWYDAPSALMYSLSVSADDVDGLDLTALAEQVYIPMMRGL